jgi:hypothetical protein
MRWIVLIAALWPGLACAEWVRLTTDAEIEAALAGRVLIHDRHTAQSFTAGGETLHVTDRAAAGLWEARDGRYCSAWPPGETWTCYELEVQGPRLRFRAQDGRVSEARYGE